MTRILSPSSIISWVTRTKSARLKKQSPNRDDEEVLECHLFQVDFCAIPEMGFHRFLIDCCLRNYNL